MSESSLRAASLLAEILLTCAEEEGVDLGLQARRTRSDLSDVPPRRRIVALAKAIGISYRTLRGLLSGSDEPKDETLRKVARYLSCSEGEVWTWAQEKQRPRANVVKIADRLPKSWTPSRG